MSVIEFSNVSRRFEVKRDRRNSFHEIFTGIFRPRIPDEVFWALRDVSFSIRKGETVGLIGHNGSGKSTTLKLITRILQPTTGRIVVDGRISALLELGSGFHPDLTGRENIYLNGSLLGFTRADMSTKIEQIIDFSEMREFIDMPVKHYSSGMYMRLGFAVAIYVDPDILITDEVLAVGDEAFQRKCMERIYALKKRGKTILFVSHALGHIINLCDRALWFDHGKLMIDSTPTEAVDAYLADTNKRDAKRRKDEKQKQVEKIEAIRIETTESGTAKSSNDQPNPQPSEDTTQVNEVEEVEEEYDAFRWGSYEAEITAVEFLNSAQEPIETATTNESLTIRMHYLAHEPINDPVFGIAVHHRNGMHINGPNSRFAGLEIEQIAGVGYVDYTMPKMPLLEGEYDISVAIYDHTMSVAYDHQDRKHALIVRTASIAERYGIMYIPSEWDIYHETLSVKL